MGYTQETAEAVALNVLAWLTANDALLPVFMGSSGVSEKELRARASDPVFLGSVLDFVLMDDAWVMEACDAQGIPYDRLMMARQALPGGAEVSWT